MIDDALDSGAEIASARRETKFPVEMKSWPGARREYTDIMTFDV